MIRQPLKEHAIVFPGNGGFMQSTVDRFGRVVIPKTVRDALHLTPGTALSVEQHNGAVVFKPTCEDVPASQESPLRRKSGLLVFSGQPVGDLAAAVTAQRSDRIAKVAAWQAE
jgi:AbrB family looped-hinge helix DNA binding protein